MFIDRAPDKWFHPVGVTYLAAHRLTTTAPGEGAEVKGVLLSNLVPPLRKAPEFLMRRWSIPCHPYGVTPLAWGAIYKHSTPNGVKPSGLDEQT